MDTHPVTGIRVRWIGGALMGWDDVRIVCIVACGLIGTYLGALGGQVARHVLGL